jgi:hypothetical protein
MDAEQLCGFTDFGRLPVQLAYLGGRATLCIHTPGVSVYLLDHVRIFGSSFGSILQISSDLLDSIPLLLVFDGFLIPADKSFQNGM